MRNCLIIDKMHESIVPLLKEIGVEPDYRPKITISEVEQIIGNYEGLILRSKLKLSRALLEKGERLRYVARAGAGVDQIDEDYLAQRNITLLNAPEGNRDAVGEHTLGMLLCLFNRLNLADLEVRAGKWRREENRGHEIKGKIIGIVGYGNMGNAFAKRLQGFECEVLAYDKFKEGYGNEFAKEVSLEELQQKADVISFHIPLNQHNKYLVSDAYLKGFKKSIYIINLARGEVIPLSVLVSGIKSGKIIGAGLDVLENEKLDTLTPQQSEDFQFLTKQEKVLFSPHVGGWTFESYVRLNEVLVDKIHDLHNN
ncbi:MAG: D-3-phosphoglycerate dehydrogenase [Arenicella sp.]|jgi:D-3-phosphoglycerate dehydrogenase